MTGDLKVQVAVGDAGGGGGSSVGGGGGSNADLCACLERLLGGQPGSQGAQQQKEVFKQGMVNSYKDPSFMSIFRPLLALEGLTSMVRNSSIANTYLGAMGKVFSAAMDMLLLPFTPFLSGLLILMAKLLPTIMKISDFISSAMGSFVDWIKKLAGDFGKIWDALKDPSKWFTTLPGLIVQGIKDFFGGFNLKNLAGGAAMVGGVAVGSQILAGMLGVPGIGGLSLGGKLLSKTWVGGTAADTAAGTAGTAGGLSMFGKLGVAGLGLAGMGLSTQWAATHKGLGNDLGSLGTDVLSGATFGAMAGSMIPVPGVGTATGAIAGGLGGAALWGAAKLGLFGGGGGGGGGGGVSNSGSGNITMGNANTNVTVNVTQAASAQTINDAIQKAKTTDARSVTSGAQ